MKNVINEFLTNLFGTSSLSLYSSDTLLLSIDFGYVLEIAFITFCCIIVSSIFVWFFHILFERCKA